MQLNVMITSKMTRMNVHYGMHLEVITIHECNDYSKMTKINLHEGMHLEVTTMHECYDYSASSR